MYEPQAAATLALVMLCCSSCLLVRGSSDGTTDQLDLVELDQYLAWKLSIVANLSLAERRSVLNLPPDWGSGVRIVYFGNYHPDETSVFQSSLSLLALLVRYSHRSSLSVGFVDTATSAGRRLSRDLGVARRHSIVAYTGGGAGAGHDFHGFRNVQLLLDFVERLLPTPLKPRRLAQPRDKAVIDRSREASVLLLSEESAAGGPDRARWTAELVAMASQLPTFVGAGRRLAGAFGVAPDTLLYHSPATAAFVSARLRAGDSIRCSMWQLRAASVLPLGANNLYLPAAESVCGGHWPADGSSRGSHSGGWRREGDSGGDRKEDNRVDDDGDSRADSGSSNGGHPLLILLADQGGQATASAALALLKRLRQTRPLLRPLVATLNPWQRSDGAPVIDWAGILGNGQVRLDRGPCLLLTVDRLFGSGFVDDVFYLDSHRQQLAAAPSADHEAAFAELSRWLHQRLDSSGQGDSRVTQRVEL